MKNLNDGKNDAQIKYSAPISGYLNFRIVANWGEITN